MLKKLGIVVLVFVVILVGLAGFIATRPGEFHVERKIMIHAPADAIFAHINDFHKWDAWSPWAKLDPNAKNSFAGPESGEGAIMKWAGNSDVGEGSMTLTESKPHERIKIKLDFTKPQQDTSNVEFHLKADGEKTVVTWSMHGNHTFVSKALCVFVFNMDKMIGEKFEEGLKTMKSVAETKSK